MKRTNLVLDEALLKEATRTLGQKTYSATVNAALKEIVRQTQFEDLADFVGKIEWIGDLSEMREDRPRRPASPASNRRTNGSKAVAQAICMKHLVDTPICDRHIAGPIRGRLSQLSTSISPACPGCAGGSSRLRGRYSLDLSLWDRLLNSTAIERSVAL